MSTDVTVTNRARRVQPKTAGMDSIREVIACPKTGGGVAPLTDAPGRGSV